MLSGFLKIPTFGAAEEQGKNLTDLPEELIDALNYFSSAEQQDKLLESYALSKLIDLLNP